MDVLFAHQQVDAGDGQHDGKQKNGRGGGVGGIAAGIAVEHIIDIAHNGIHACGVQVRAEQGHGIGIGLEGPDEAGDHQVEKAGGDHGQGDAPENPAFGCSVHPGGVAVGLVYGGQGRGENQNLEGHDDPHGVKAQYQHLRPVWPREKVHAGKAQGVQKHIHKTVGIGGLPEEDHEHQAHGQGIGHIGQEENGLEQLPQLLNGAQAQGDEQGQSRGQGHRDDHQQEGVF